LLNSFILLLDKSMKEKIKNLFKNLRRLSIIFLLLVILSLISNIILFSYPWERIDLGCSPSAEGFSVPDENIVKPSFKSFLADSLQIPLNLRWYKIYIKNIATSSVGCIVNDRDPVLAIWIPEDKGLLFRNESSFLKNEMLDENSYAPDNQGIVHAEEEKFFLYSGTEGFILSGIWWNVGCLNNDNFFDHSNLKYCVQAQPHTSAWLAKFVLMFILWMFLLSSILTIYGLVSSGIKK